MSRIANRRALALAVQHLVKINAPDLPDYQAVANALAQVMTDDTGIAVTLVMRVSRDAVEKASS